MDDRISGSLKVESPNPGEPTPAPGDDPSPSPHPNPPIKSKPAEHNSHVVQLYDADENALTANVVSFLADGLKLGHGAVIIAIPAHKAAFHRNIVGLGIDAESEIEAGRLVFLDAQTTLARIMAGGHPDGERFDRIVGTVVREVRSLSRDNALRAYGEMVGLLWKAKQFPAAIRLEQLWNALRSSVSFDLFCSYPIDVFDKDFDMSVVDAILCAHTHLLSTSANASLQTALDRAIDEIHGSRSTITEGRSQKNPRKDWATLPDPEATILLLRANLPDKAEEILARARTYFQESA